MAKVSNVSHAAQAEEKASNQLLKEILVTDERGRKILLKKPKTLDLFRLIEILGSAADRSNRYVSMMHQLLYVKEIDGIPIAQISVKEELEALINRLDDDGMEAVIKGIGKLNPENEIDKEIVKK